MITEEGALLAVYTVLILGAAALIAQPAPGSASITVLSTDDARASLRLLAARVNSADAPGKSLCAMEELRSAPFGASFGARFWSGSP